MEQLRQETLNTKQTLKTTRLINNDSARTIIIVLQSLSIGTIDEISQMVVNGQEVEQICLIHREDSAFIRECASPPCNKCLGVIKQTGVNEITITAHNQIHREAISSIAGEIGRELHNFSIKTTYKSTIGEIFYTDCQGNKCLDY